VGRKVYEEDTRRACPIEQTMDKIPDKPERNVMCNWTWNFVENIKNIKNKRIFVFFINDREFKRKPKMKNDGMRNPRFSGPDSGEFKPAFPGHAGG
jgi:hypothetical protein